MSASCCYDQNYSQDLVSVNGLLCKPKDLRLNPLHPCKELGVSAWAWNPSIGAQTAHNGSSMASPPRQNQRLWLSRQ